jgi:hypothetical protein
MSIYYRIMAIHLRQRAKSAKVARIGNRRFKETARNRIIESAKILFAEESLPADHYRRYFKAGWII